MYTGIASIVDKNHIIIKPIRKYTYSNVYDADGRNPYETDDYIPVRTDVEISGQNIIVKLWKYHFLSSFFFLQIASGVEYELPKFVETNDKKTMDPTQLLWHRNIPESLVIIGGVFVRKQ